MFIKLTGNDGLRKLVNIGQIRSVSEEKDGEGISCVVPLINGGTIKPRESFERIRARIEECLEESRLMRVVLEGENDEDLNNEV